MPTPLIEKLVGGISPGLTWSLAFSPSTFAGLPALDTAIQSDIVIDNSVNLDLYADLSLVFTQPFNTGAGAYTWFFLYPLNQDGSTFGNNRYTTQWDSGLPTPPRQYLCGASVFQTGNIPQYGTSTSILLPPGKFKFVVFNPNTGGKNIPFPSSGANIYYRTYSRTIG